MKKIINITHTDSDGVGCGIVCKFFGRISGHEVEVINCGYSAINNRVREIIDRLPQEHESIAQVIISDISVKESSGVDKLIDQAAIDYPEVSFRLLDHHSTSMWLNKYPWAYVKETDETLTKHCGTWLVYNMLHPVFEGCHVPGSAVLKEYVHVIDLYDTWRWIDDYQDDHFELANDLDRIMKIKGKDSFTEDMLKKMEGDPVYFDYKNKYPTSLIDPIDETLIRYKGMEIERQVESKEHEMAIGEYVFQVRTKNLLELVKQHFMTKYLDNPYALSNALKKWKLGSSQKFNVGVIYSTENISEVGNILAVNHPELDFIMIIAMPATISYRGVKDLEIPLGIIAADIGNGKGGGHDNASGSPLSKWKIKDVSTDLIHGLSIKQV